MLLSVPTLQADNATNVAAAMSLFICKEATPPAPSASLREMLISRNPVCQLSASGGLSSIKYQYYGHQFTKFRKSSSYKHQKPWMFLQSPGVQQYEQRADL